MSSLMASEWRDSLSCPWGTGFLLRHGVEILLFLGGWLCRVASFQVRSTWAASNVFSSRHMNGLARVCHLLLRLIRPSGGSGNRIMGNGVACT